MTSTFEQKVKQLEEIVEGTKHMEWERRQELIQDAIDDIRKEVNNVISGIVKKKGVVFK